MCYNPGISESCVPFHITVAYLGLLKFYNDVYRLQDSSPSLKICKQSISFPWHRLRWQYLKWWPNHFLVNPKLRCGWHDEGNRYICRKGQMKNSKNSFLFAPASSKIPVFHFFLRFPAYSRTAVKSLRATASKKGWNPLQTHYQGREGRAWVYNIL